MTVVPGTIAVTPGAGKILDTAELTVNGNIVERECVVITSPSLSGNYAEVTVNNALQVDATATTQPIIITNQPVGISGAVTVLNPNQVTIQQPLGISGSVSINNFPATQSISGNISVNNFPISQQVTISQPVAVSGTLTVVQPLGSNLHVDVDNFSSQSFTIAQPLGISGTVSINQPVAITGNVSVLNFPVVQTVYVEQPVGVTGNFYQATQPISISQPIGVSGAISVINTVAVSGTVNVLQGTSPWVTSVTNFPAIQPVSFNQPIGVSGSVTVLNPSSVTINQPLGISGSVSVINTITGTITNFPVVQTVYVEQPVGVTGLFYQSTQPVSINTPLGISGSVTVLNPSAVTISTPLGISGSVSVNNFISGYVAPLAPTVGLTISVVVSLSGSGAFTLIPGSGSKTVRVMRMLLVVGGSTNIVFQDNVGNVFTGPMPLIGSSGIVLDDSGEPWFITLPGNGFAINSNTPVQISGTIWYTQS